MQVSYDICYINDIIGSGIICREKIKKGDVIWNSIRTPYDKHTHKNTLTIHEDTSINVITFNETNLEEYLEELSSDEDVKRFLDLSYGVSGDIHYILDDGKYVNHSSEPNCITIMDNATTYALRDIEIGEMLTEDYSSYSHPDYLKRALKKYGYEPTYYSWDN